MTYEYWQPGYDSTDDEFAEERPGLSRGREISPFSQKVIRILERWFQRIESGEAEGVVCDPLPELPDEKVNLVVEKIDQRISWELDRTPAHWMNKGIDTAPEFSRLPLAARRAMVNELRQLVLQSSEAEFKVA